MTERTYKFCSWPRAVTTARKAFARLKHPPPKAVEHAVIGYTSTHPPSVLGVVGAALGGWLGGVLG